MHLYLIRHAEAVDLTHAQVRADAERFLTDMGQVQARRLGAWFRRRGVRLSAILTSPMVRARQTADGILAELPQPSPVLVEVEEIAGEMRPKRVLPKIRELGEDPAALIGHQPTLGRFLGWLIGDRKVRLHFDKGGIALLEVSEWAKGGAELRWLVTHDWLTAEVA